MFVGIACGVFFLICLALACCGGIEKFSHIGGAFNILSALFAGLAFAAICSQLRMQQSQIDEERQTRQRAERIAALSTLIQVTFQKILYEREILIRIADEFKNISFLHEGDGLKTGQAINAKEGIILSLGELIDQITEAQASGAQIRLTSGSLKDLWDNQAALEMLKHIKKLVDLLNSYESEMNGLLKAVPETEMGID